MLRLALDGGLIKEEGKASFEDELDVANKRRLAGKFVGFEP